MLNDKLKELSFVVFDIETTGLDNKKDQIIEIGATKVSSSGEIINTFSKFIKLYKVDKLPELIINLTNITDQMLSEQGEDYRFVMESFSDFVGKSILVAQNARFDLSFLMAYYMNEKKEFYANYYLDTIHLAKVIYPNKSTYKLSELINYFEIEYDAYAHHRADYDATITAQILIKQLKLLQVETIDNLQDLIKVSQAIMITEKQEAFLNSLLTKNKINQSAESYLTKDVASIGIDLLLNLK